MRIPALLIAVAVVWPAAAQELPAFPQPTDEHKLLEKFVGAWEVTSEGMMEGQPPVESKGTMNSRMLGGFWTLNEMKTEFGEVTVHGVQTIGYDAEKEKYVGTWVDSMFNYMWHYEGSVDQAGTTLTLEAEGPDLSRPGEMTQFQDIYEFKSDDHIVATSKMLTGDGEWVTFMVGQMHRKK